MSKEILRPLKILLSEYRMNHVEDRKHIKVRDDQISHNFPQDSQSEGHERKLTMLFR